MGNVEVAHKDGPKFNKNVYTCNLLACVQTSPLPQKKKIVSSPDFLSERGGTSVHRLAIYKCSHCLRV